MIEFNPECVCGGSVDKPNPDCERCVMLTELQRAKEMLADWKQIVDDYDFVMSQIHATNFLAESRNRAFQMQGAYDGSISEDCKEFLKREELAIARIQARLKCSIESPGEPKV